jgi:translation initiation factor IF-3
MIEMEKKAQIIENMKLKEFRVRAIIGENDLLVKLNLMKKSLEKYCRITVFIEGKDSMKNLEIAIKLKNNILESIKDIVIDKDITSEYSRATFSMHKK